jgi:hypothetical protein
MANAATRSDRRIPWWPGRYSKAGRAVWLMTKISGKPQGALRVAAAAGGAATSRRPNALMLFIDLLIAPSP